MKTFATGDLVKSLNGKLIGEVIEVLENTVLVETGHRIIIKHKTDIENFLKVGDNVYIGDTNKKIQIAEFYFSDKSLGWKAAPYGDLDHKEGYSVDTLQEAINIVF